MGEYAIQEVYPDLLDGMKFITIFDVLSLNRFRVPSGMVGERLEGSTLKCKKIEKSFLDWDRIAWQFVPFTGRVQWYIGMGWDTVGEFKDGILQKKLIWSDR
jgi:hypothetical protein